MSTVIATNLSDGVTAIPCTDIIEGTAKMTVHYKQVLPVSVGESYNVASVTDNTTGVFTVNYTNPFSSVFYRVAANGMSASLNDAGHLSISAGVSPLTTSIQMNSGVFNGYSPRDLDDAMVTSTGTLA